MVIFETGHWQFESLPSIIPHISLQIVLGQGRPKWQRVTRLKTEKEDCKSFAQRLDPTMSIQWDQIGRILNLVIKNYFKSGPNIW